MHTIPDAVREGMKVYDSAMHAIGTVETFRASETAPDHPEAEATDVSPLDNGRRDTIVDAVAEVFRGDDELPRELQEKALREGYVLLDADGLFASDRYIFPEHIDRIEGGRLVLAVRKDDLLKV